jgi:serine/threonine protein kinase
MSKGLVLWLSPLCFANNNTTQENILVNDDLEATLTDFGISRILQISGFTMTTTAGTWRFMAPELLEAEDEPITQVTASTDVWAFSMIVLEMRTLVDAFNPQSYMEHRYSPNAFHSGTLRTMPKSLRLSQLVFVPSDGAIRRSMMRFGTNWNRVGISKPASDHLLKFSRDSLLRSGRWQ